MAKTITDFLPQMIIISIFCWISNLYNTIEMYLVYYFLITSVVFCCQCVAQISATLFPEDTKLSLFTAIMINLSTLITSNSLFYLKELHYSVQTLSCLSYSKAAFECLLIIIYGFDRCSEDQISTVLYSYEIETQDFWPNVINLIIICCSLKLMSFVVLIMKVNISLKNIQSSKQLFQDQQYQFNKIDHVI